MNWMKSKYYSLARSGFAHSLQIRNKFFVGASLYFMSKLLGILCLLHNITKHIGMSKHSKLLVVAALAFAFVPIANAAGSTNVSLMYGWNGTNFVPLLTNADGIH